MPVACVTRRQAARSPGIALLPALLLGWADAQTHGSLWEILFNKNNNKYHGRTIFQFQGRRTCHLRSLWPNAPARPPLAGRSAAQGDGGPAARPWRARSGPGKRPAMQPPRKARAWGSVSLFRRQNATLLATVLRLKVDELSILYLVYLAIT